MHHDEANQAVKFGALLERGEYRYDAHDHHGPTLYYLTLPSPGCAARRRWPRSTNGRSAACRRCSARRRSCCCRCCSAGIGRTAVVAAARADGALARDGLLLADVHPGVDVRLLRAGVRDRASDASVTEGGLAWAALAGIAAGLAVATKETAVIVLPAVARGLRDRVVVAGSRAAAERAGRRALARGGPRGPGRRSGGRGALLFVVFRRARQPSSSRFRAAGTYLDRGIDPASHAQPWHYYLRPAHVVVVRRPDVERGTGARAGGRRRDRRPGAIGRLAPGSQLLAAIPHRQRRHRRGDLLGHSLQDALEPAAVLRRRDRRSPASGSRRSCTGSRVPRGAASLLAARARDRGPATSGGRRGARRSPTPRTRAIRTSTPRPSPTPSAWRRASAIWPPCTPMARGCRCRSLRRPHEQWPLPWYLRAMPHVGYWTAPGDVLALQAPVIVVVDRAHAGARRRRSAIATCRSSSDSGPKCSWRSTSSVGCGIGSSPSGTRPGSEDPGRHQAAERSLVAPRISTRWRHCGGGACR